MHFKLVASPIEFQVGNNFSHLRPVSLVYALTLSPTSAWAANNFGNETKRAIGMGLHTEFSHREPGTNCWLLALPSNQECAILEDQSYRRMRPAMTAPHCLDQWRSAENEQHPMIAEGRSTDPGESVEVTVSTDKNHSLQCGRWR